MGRLLHFRTEKGKQHVSRDFFGIAFAKQLAQILLLLVDNGRTVFFIWVESRRNAAFAALRKEVGAVRAARKGMHLCAFGLESPILWAPLGTARA